MDGDISRIKGVLRLEKDHRPERGNQIEEYTTLFDKADAEKRKNNYAAVVNKYYDLATDFYEFGWGMSFHFAARHKSESLESSIARHEIFLANKLKLKEGQRALDLGCGVGGPLRTISTFSGASVVGLNNNEYQVLRARRLAQISGLTEQQASFVKGDFLHIPFDDASFDVAYQIEASCHAPNRVDLYKEVLRILKPGGYFGGYEWVMTDKFNPADPQQVAVKEGIERGNGLPDLITDKECIEALKEAGFEVLESFDLSPESEIPWYFPLTGRLTPTGIFHMPLGRWIAKKGLAALEYLRLAPAGSSATLDMLQRGAVNLVEGGRTGIFTPSFTVICRKLLH